MDQPRQPLAYGLRRGLSLAGVALLACSVALLIYGATDAGARSHAGPSAWAAAKKRVGGHHRHSVRGCRGRVRSHHRRCVRRLSAKVVRVDRRRASSSTKGWFTPAPVDWLHPLAPPRATAPGAPTNPAQQPPLGHQVGVSSREFSLTLSRPEVASGSVKVELRNAGEDPHNLQLDDSQGNPVGHIGDLAPGAVDTATLSLPPGSYQLYCSLSGHRAKGMRATLQAR